MANLIDQRCFNHSLRVAAARCLECGNYYCRECVTEHRDRVICAACLQALVKRPLPNRKRFAWVFRSGQLLLGFFLAWVCFYLLGEFLVSLPSAFHEATLWQTTGLE